MVGERVPRRDVAYIRCITRLRLRKADSFGCCHNSFNILLNRRAKFYPTWFNVVGIRQP